MKSEEGKILQLETGCFQVLYNGRKFGYFNSEHGALAFLHALKEDQDEIPSEDKKE